MKTFLTRSLYVGGWAKLHYDKTWWCSAWPGMPYLFLSFLNCYFLSFFQVEQSYVMLKPDLWLGASYFFPNCWFLFFSFKFDLRQNTYMVHIGWGDNFPLWEERLFIEGIKAFSVLRGLGSGLFPQSVPNLGKLTWSSKVS